MRRILYIYSGEGTQNDQSSNKLVKTSRRWGDISEILRRVFDIDIEQLWIDEIGSHRCPHSPLLTVVSQICLSEIWSRWGHRPDVVIGHSIGELSAAFEAGLYSLEEVLRLAFQLGRAAAKLDGVMMHGTLTDEQISQLNVSLSSLNFRDGDGKHITVSGNRKEMERFLCRTPGIYGNAAAPPLAPPGLRPVSGRSR